MNILNDLDTNTLNSISKYLPYINLHTRNKDKAIKQSINFFASYERIKDDYYFYTYSINYEFYGGACYKLGKDASIGVYFLILQK